MSFPKITRRVTGLAACATLSTLPALALAGGNSIPFQATISITEQAAVQGSPCFLVSQVAGHGVARALGPVTLRSTDCINPLSASGDVLGFASTSVVLSAPAGEIWATYSGRFTSAGVLTGTFTVVGGTGHYENASGSGTMTGTEGIDPATLTGAGTIQLDGKLSF